MKRIPAGYPAGVVSGSRSVIKRKEEPKMLTEKLKSLSVNRESTEDLMELYVGAQDLANGYSHFTMDVPEWLSASIKHLNSEITMRNRDELDRKLSQAKQRVEKFKSREEKAAEAAKELAALEALAGK